LNEQQPIPPTIYEVIMFTFEYVQTHYYLYAGVLMRIFLDYNKWNIVQLTAYIVVSVLLVDSTRHLMELNANTTLVTAFVCMVLGFVGHTILRFILEDFSRDFMLAIKDKIMRWVEK
jgi:hypothetical protein